MKALSVHPEHAELFRLGIRTIETRGWSTSYRGPLAIVSTKRDPDSAAARRDPISQRALAAIPHGNPLPRGVVVATCTLVDVVPIVGRDDVHLDVNQCRTGQRGFVWQGAKGLERYRWNGCQYEWVITEDTESQRPYGDFSPGQFAWLLADIKPLDPPIPAKGRQGLWEWSPDA